MRRLTHLFNKMVDLGVSEDCDEDERTTRRVLMGAWIGVSLVTPAWGVVYIAFGETAAGLIPITYAGITYLSFVLLWKIGGWHWIRVSQLTLHFILPFALMWILGGFVLGSAVLVWALLAPLSSLWGGQSREAAFSIVGFVLFTVLSGVLEPHLRESNNLPEWLRITMFAANFSAMSIIIFLLVDFYVRKKNMTIMVMRRNRELESAYLAQEISLRQNDKLATLGRLSAGMAHELNNPTAAAQQATRELDTLLHSERQADAEQADFDLGERETALFDEYRVRIDSRVRAPEFLDPLTRSDLESEVQDALEHMGIDQAWELSPPVVAMGLDSAGLVELADLVGRDRLADVVNVLVVRYRRQALLSTIGESTSRIIKIVKALKTYSYLDQGPRQLVDVHEGIESTLVVLQSLLKTGVEVQRAYDPDLPPIEAQGSELNQVWTNIIDNAIDAMGGEGVIVIKTRRDGDHVVVEISDSGPGIPTELLAQIFDPFVTTKAPGEGTGLGLNIAHNIVTQRHGGHIRVTTGDEGTAFTVTLPLITPKDIVDRSSADAAPKNFSAADK